MSGETVQGRLALFGHEPVPATVELRARSRRWRVGRALRAFAIALLIAPLVGLVPPHAPWALGALGLGAILARRRWRERTTLLAAAGSCPRCGRQITLEGPTRLRRPHPVACEGCHHESALHVGEPEGHPTTRAPAP